jgi:hypothetical protein
LVAEGIDFNHAVAAVTYYSRKLRSQPYTASEKETKIGDEVKTQWYQKWNDGLGYCKSAFIPTETFSDIPNRQRQVPGTAWAKI